MKVPGTTSGLSAYYPDGTESMEIWVNETGAACLPYREGERGAVKLKTGSAVYTAGIRSTTGNEHAWVYSDQYDDHDARVRLADAPTGAGLGKNRRVFQDVAGDRITVLPAS